MSYASRVGFCNEVAIDSAILSERAGVGVGLGVADGLGEGGGLAFCGGLTTAGGGVAIAAFSFSEGSVVSLGKRGIFGSFELGDGRAGDELTIDEKIETPRTGHLNPCLRTSSFRIHRGGKDCLSRCVFGRDPLARGRESKQKRIRVHPGYVRPDVQGLWRDARSAKPLPAPAEKPIPLYLVRCRFLE